MYKLIITENNNDKNLELELELIGLHANNYNALKSIKIKIPPLNQTQFA